MLRRPIFIFCSAPVLSVWYEARSAGRVASAPSARGNEHDAVAEKFEVRAQLAEEQAELIRDLLMSGKIKVEESEAEVVGE